MAEERLSESIFSMKLQVERIAIASSVLYTTSVFISFACKEKKHIKNVP